MLLSSLIATGRLAEIAVHLDACVILLHSELSLISIYSARAPFFIIVLLNSKACLSPVVTAVSPQQLMGTASCLPPPSWKNIISARSSEMATSLWSKSAWRGRWKHIHSHCISLMHSWQLSAVIALQGAVLERLQHVMHVSLSCTSGFLNPDDRYCGDRHIPWIKPSGEFTSLAF